MTCRTRFSLAFIAGLIQISLLFGQWKQTKGPYSETVFSIALSGRNVLAVRFGGISITGKVPTVKPQGFFLSSDGGISWSPSTLVAPGYSSLIALGKAVLVQTTNYPSDPLGPKVYYRSTDSGEHWNPGSDTSLENGFSGFAVNGSLLYGANVTRGVYVSPDSGATWTPIDTTIKGFQLAVDDSIIAVTDHGSLYLSTNKGASWSAVTVTENGSHVGIFGIGVSGLNIVANGYGSLVSTDLGLTWRQSSVANVNNFTMKGKDLYACCCGPFTSHILRSTDGGSTWNGIDSLNACKFGYSSVASLAINDSEIYAGTDGSGVMRSRDYGTTWVQLNSLTGIPNTSVNTLTVSGTSVLAGAAPDGLFRTNDGGESWTSVNSGIANLSIDALATHKGTLYAGAGDLYGSTNNGEQWDLIIPKAPAASAICFNDTCILVGGGPGVFSLAIADTAWKNFSLGLSSYFGVSALLANNLGLFAGADDGMYRYDTLWYPRRVAFRLCWMKFNSGLTGFPVRALGSDGSSVFAATSNGIFSSSDSGYKWSRLDSGLACANFTCMTRIGENIFVGTHAVMSDSGTVVCPGGGVLLSTNNGTTWKGINEGLAAMNILSITTTEREIIVGTDSAGVWLRPLSEVMGTQVAPPFAPVIFGLSQNYPNPFNPSTFISYQLPEQAIVSLKVYDVLGRVVRSLVNERQGAGPHSALFDGSRLASGIYFYRLEAGDRRATKKMILLK